MSLAYSLSLTTPGEKPGSDHQGKMSEAEVMEVFRWLQCGHWYSSAKTQPTKSFSPTLLSQNNTKPEEIFKRGTISRDNIRSPARPEDQKDECKLKHTHHTDLRKDPGGIVWNVTPVKGGK